MSNRVVVLVPIYRRDLSPNESFCLRRCSAMLPDLPKYVLAPKGLALNGLLKRFAFDGVVERAPCFFQSQWTYNWMLLDWSLYAALEPFEYVLVHQLDAFLFRRGLEDFCDLGYDYIGAPWPKSFQTRSGGGEYGAVGNGGLSLRRVARSREVLERCSHESAELFDAGIRGPGGAGTWLKKCSLLTRAGRWTDTGFRRIVLRWRSNEDIFWALAAPRVRTGFRVAPIEVAARFSIDLAPDEFLEDPLASELPLGCHGWPSNAPELWARVRAALGAGHEASETLERLS